MVKNSGITIVQHTKKPYRREMKTTHRLKGTNLKVIVG